MNNYDPIKDIQKKRRFKYGAFAVTLTAAVIALVVVINAIFTALCEKNGWFIDMTERDLYTPDPDAFELLEQYRGSEEFNVEFIFCMEEDKLIKNELCNMINEIIKRYAEEYDFISVKYIDINRNPQLLDNYLNNTAASPTSTSVIVTNGDKNNSIVYSIRSFFVSSDGTTDTIYAINADQKIVSAVMRLSGDQPVASFTTGHGETVDDTLTELFEDAGYKVETVDLVTQELDPATKVVVINNPTTDFSGAKQAVNEIKKLDNLLDGSAGLMVFLDNEKNELPVLEDFLEQWGVRFERQSVIDTSSCVPGDETVIYAKYTTSGNGSSITESLRESSSPQKPVITKCRPITLLYGDAEETAKYFSNNGATRYASSVLTTSSNAQARSLEGGETVKEGVMNVLTLTVQNRYEDNVQQQSFLLAGGTNAFSESQYINGSFYANKDILYNTMKIFGKTNVPVGMTAKVFSDDSLSITAEEANRWTAICTVLFPAIVAGVGIFVYARRRYL